MEGNSFVAPGHLPLKWNYYGPPEQPPVGYQHQKEAAWMTPEIRAELQTRNRLKEVSRETGNHEDCQAYQAQCEKVQNMIDNSKSSFGLHPHHNSGHSPYTVHNSDGINFGSVPLEYQYPAHSQGMPVANSRAAYYHTAANYYSEREKRRFLSCGPCNRTFYNKQRLDEHLKEHVECPFPECKLSAHIKIIDQHINNQHMLVNFANLQIDDETWIAERKKRFPTAQRAELRRAEQMEKLKRGEKLGQNKKPFKKDKGKYNKTVKTVMQKEYRDGKTHKYIKKEAAEDVSTINAPDESKNGRGKIKRKKTRRWDGPTSLPKAFLEVDLLDSDSEVKDGLPAFRGTKQFYESTGEVSYFGNKNLDIVDRDDNMETYKDADIDISDDEEWHTVIKDKDASAGTLVLGGALGSLMGAYSDSEEESEDLPVPSQNDEKLKTLPLNSVIYDPSQSQKKSEDTGGNEQNVTQNANTAGKRKIRRQPRHQKGTKGLVAPKRFPFPKRRKTLLEKLLQPYIVHERNVILQCVRFIVENDFFDVIDDSECVEMKDVTSEKVMGEQRMIGEKIGPINNHISECVEMKDVTDEKVMGGQGMIEGLKIGPIKESKEVGETFGKSEARGERKTEKMQEEKKAEKVEEEVRNLEEIVDESARSEVLVDKDKKSKLDICASDFVDHNTTATERTGGSFSVIEDDGGYESDKEVVSKKGKNEESNVDSEIVVCKGTDTLLKDNERTVDLPNENKS
ncbi:uncharacterized protein Nufip [Panulirus ornatus]|uniref:uncharacterized protein Nufip n=1 Tax=Panulirus ornatus TaxID=150431 RepID=UPI003A8BE8F8